MASIAITVPIFAVGGAISRFNMRTTETRWQIVAFAGLSFGLEAAIELGARHRASVARAFANTVAAGLIITAVKFDLEPGARRADSAAVRHVGKQVARTVADRQ